MCSILWPGLNYEYGEPFIKLTTGIVCLSVYIVKYNKDFLCL